MEASESDDNQMILREESKIAHSYLSEDEYPIIWYEPDIDSEEKKVMKALIQENSLIHLFSELPKVLEFAQALGVSFLVIAPSEVDEEKFLKDFAALKDVHGRTYFDFEEEAVIKSLFKEISEQRIKSLKVYVFCTREDFLSTPPVNEEEEEVKVMCPIKEMADQFREEFTIFWCDPDSNSPQKKEAFIKQFDLLEQNIFTELDGLLEKLENYNGLPYHLLLSGKTEIKQMVDQIDDFKDLIRLYIYDTSLVITGKKGWKIKTGKTSEEIIPKVMEGIRSNSIFKNTFPAFAAQFNDWDKSHINKVYYYLKGLRNFNNRRQAKQDFVNLAKRIYQSKKLLDFEKEYNEYNKALILQWYTAQSPVYKLINNCLRISTSDSINYCRFVLKDLERAIIEEFQQEKKRDVDVVYRAAYISNKELEELERNVGKEIEMYGFLSATKSLQVAQNYLWEDVSKMVLTTIIMPPLSLSELDDQGFADINKFSAYSNEEEILFNVRSRFQVLKVGKIQLKTNNSEIECQHLVLLYGAQFLRKYMTTENPKMSLKLKLPFKLRCNKCESGNNLFAYSGMFEETEIICQKCFVTGEFTPKNTFLLPIDDKAESDGERLINIEVKGEMLEFGYQAKLAFELSCRCNQCMKSEEKQVYKWMNLETSEILAECFDCFQASKERKLGYILISEDDTHLFWNRNQEEWEKAGLDFKTREFEDFDYYNEAKIFQKTQDFQKCQQYCKISLKKFARKAKREHSKLISYAALASVHESLKEDQKALEYHFKILDIFKFHYGEMHLITAPSYHNIAKTYESLRNYKQALEYQLMALKIFTSAYEETHPHISASFSNLATMYRELGMKQEALYYNQKALDIHTRIFGENHPKTATSFKNFAFLYEGFEDYQKALEYHLKTLNIRKGIFGETHPETATAYSCLGIISGILGDDKKALDYHLKALDIKRSIYGEIHPDIANSYNSLALLCQKSGSYQKALEYYLKAMNIKISTLGASHSDMATSYNNIALMYQKKGMYQEALEYGKKSLNIDQSTFGEMHEKTATSYNTLGMIYKDLGNYQEALKFHRKDLEIIIINSGEASLKAATAFNNLAAIYENLDELENAAKYFLKALDIFKSKYGEEHETIAVLYNNLASVLHKMGDYSQTLEYQLKSLEMFKAKYGETHPDTSTFYFNLATTYDLLRDYQRALEYYLKALDIDKSTFGEHHPNMLFLYSHLISVYRQLGVVQKVWEFSCKVWQIESSRRA